MKILVTCILCSQFLSFDWKKDYESAKEIAHRENKQILLNFSGSDWSAPCKKMRKGLFLDSVFLNFANESLILINIDFPKDMKDISVNQNTKNESIADQFNPEGEFPMTLLLDRNGEVIEKWIGIIKFEDREFIKKIKSVIQKGKN